MERSRGRGRGNPWNRGGQNQNNAHGYGKGSHTKPESSARIQAEQKFQLARAEMQAAVQKHIKHDYESSSEEEELESDNILGSVLKSYSQLGGTSVDLGRTQRFLEDAFQSGAATCLICIATVKRTDAIWNCSECFCFMHLPCIQRWAKDSIIHKKTAAEDNPLLRASSPEFTWACPKCRHEYPHSGIPQRYQCFCGRVDDPPFHPWNVPHSCGETCGRHLKPLCGHDCLLLCHPGPCPPCPKTVKSTCHCGKKPARLQRCSQKEWSCISACGKTLKCGLHTCNQICHLDSCAPCPKKSTQKCQCGRNEQLRTCADPQWQCEEKCTKRLECGNHACERVCHAGACGPCPLSLSRTCPCGKASYTLPCTADTPLCGDTCGRLLECDSHVCHRPCHRDKCGSCLEVVKKTCRCGHHSKELPCQNRYLCETKCKNIRACNKHPCNRKCCDGNCPPCEKPCGRTLPCGYHKCSSICHRGPCYPCPLTVDISCRCGETILRVPCGRQKKAKPPRCMKQCNIPPQCHHPSQQVHRCHFGDCPPCKLTCTKMRIICRHKCPAQCHSAVWVSVEGPKPAGPWEKVAPVMKLQDLPCPDCKVPVAVACLGGHEIAKWPCHIAKPTSCHRPCGRDLACGNHKCDLPCHGVEGASSRTLAGMNCKPCESECTKDRALGCTHSCRKPCHPDACPPCSQMLRLRCHCGLNQLYIRCGEWTVADGEKQLTLQSCTNQCPKNYECGHRCHVPCHAGDCPDSELCTKKVKVFCSCRRLKRDFPCNIVRLEQSSVSCDDVCKQKKEEEHKARQIEQEKKRLEEERKNKEEVEKFEKKFQGRKKHRERRHVEVKEDVSFIQKYWMYLIGVFGIFLGIGALVISSH